jgi:acyl CoA:acetate/3-ketoacid CoA transferase beta subunit
MNHDSDLIAVFAVLFFTVMFWAYAAGHHIDLTLLGTAQSGYIEMDGE